MTHAIVAQSETIMREAAEGISAQVTPPQEEEKPAPVPEEIDVPVEVAPATDQASRGAKISQRGMTDPSHNPNAGKFVQVEEEVPEDSEAASLKPEMSLL